MSDTIYLTGDYGYDNFRLTGTTADLIDASDASWIVSNYGDQTNLYPFLVGNSEANMTLLGGTIDGEVPLDLEWREAYVNSAAVMVRDTEDVIIQDWDITQAWDAIRISGASDGFVIDNVYVSNVRDDAVENDDGANGTIMNSLFDGVFSGISLSDSTTSGVQDNVVTIDNVLIRMESFLYKGNVTHVSPFKMTSESPQLEIYDTVVAIEDVDHGGQWRTQMAWDKTIDASGNYFLNLSDDPLPDDYPLPGEGWTVLEGQEARDYWDQASAEWISAFDGNLPDETPVSEETPEEQPEPVEPVAEELPEEQPEPVEPVAEELPEEQTEPVEPVAEEQPEPVEPVAQEPEAQEPVAEAPVEEDTPEPAPEPEPTVTLTPTEPVPSTPEGEADGAEETGSGRQLGLLKKLFAKAEKRRDAVEEEEDQIALQDTQEVEDSGVKFRGNSRLEKMLQRHQAESEEEDQIVAQEVQAVEDTGSEFRGSPRLEDLMRLMRTPDNDAPPPDDTADLSNDVDLIA